jgi:SpoVK/Ycf46/Vps4 family AAA+-type ATPase
MSFGKEFNLLLKARYSIIYISTKEEDRLEYTIRNCLRLSNTNRGFYSWDFVDGYTNDPNTNNLAARNPLQALEFIEKLNPTRPAIFILKDFNRFLTDITISRKLRNLNRTLKVSPKTIFIIASDLELQIPDELNELITVVDFLLPQYNEIRQELLRLIKSLDQTIDPSFLENLIKSCQGLSLERIRRVLAKIIASQKQINNLSVQLILDEKRQIISQTQILEFWAPTTTINDIGGLEILKNWLFQRKLSFTERAIAYGLPPARGLLLIGVQGTGKSLTAKGIARDWQLPLLRLDFGRLFGGLVGESEARMRKMINIAEALSPCILWVDEIDKAFGQMEGKSDSGTTSRVLGTFVTWLAEKQSKVFVVATANNFKLLPLELIRKGRFDEIFFVGLPSRSERFEIFEVLLRNFRPKTWQKFDIEEFLDLSFNFSGAEIKQSIIEGMYAAFEQEREFETADIRFGLAQIIPLAQINKEEIANLQQWTKSGRIRNAS